MYYEQKGASRGVLRTNRGPQGSGRICRKYGVDGFNGKPIGFYIIQDKVFVDHSYIEDDGTTIPLLEAMGIEMMSGRRGEVFAEILREYKASYDEEAAVLRSEIDPRRRRALSEKMRLDR